jgi:hypothetical protein
MACGDKRCTYEITEILFHDFSGNITDRFPDMRLLSTGNCHEGGIGCTCRMNFDPFLFMLYPLKSGDVICLKCQPPEEPEHVQCFPCEGICNWEAKPSGNSYNWFKLNSNCSNGGEPCPPWTCTCDPPNVDLNCGVFTTRAGMTGIKTRTSCFWHEIFVA